MTIAGVYAIWCPKGIYVGQSGDIIRRQTVDTAHYLGLSWCIVRFMPGSTKNKRLREERRIQLAYKAAGYFVLDGLTENRHRYKLREAAKQNIRNGVLRTYHNGRVAWNKGGHLSDSHRLNLSGHSPWNKGLTVGSLTGRRAAHGRWHVGPFDSCERCNR